MTVAMNVLTTTIINIICDIVIIIITIIIHDYSPPLAAGVLGN